MSELDTEGVIEFTSIASTDGTTEIIVALFAPVLAVVRRTQEDSELPEETVLRVVAAEYENCRSLEEVRL